jgi:hypothetical protein
LMFYQTTAYLQENSRYPPNPGPRRLKPPGIASAND